MLRINDAQKRKVLYIWELYDVIINFQSVQVLACVFADDSAFDAVRAVKLLPLTDLNFKVSTFLYTLCIFQHTG